MLEQGMFGSQKAPKPAVLFLLRVRDIRARLRQVRLVPVLVWSWGRQVCKLEVGLPRHGPQPRPACLEYHRAKQLGVRRREALSQLAASGAAAGGPAGSWGSPLAGGKGNAPRGGWTGSTRGCHAG